MIRKKMAGVVPLILITICTVAMGVSRDVNDVTFRGDCTNFGMGITGVFATEGAFLAVTTGARYEYTPGELKVFQGLGTSKRLLCTMSFDQNAMFERVSDNNDHALFWSDKFNVGIYGDSTCIIVPRVDLTISCTGNFKPDYAGRVDGELLLIDGLGGMEIYPQRYEAGYSVQNVSLKKTAWTAKYKLKAGERVMVAAFPGKEFDWDASFKCNILFTYGGRGLGTGNPYGQMPPDSAVAKWAAQGYNIIAISYEGVYADVPRIPYPAPVGPYVIANEEEFRRVVNAAHANGMRFSVYASLYYSYTKYKDPEVFLKQVKDLQIGYAIDGIYLDGMLSEDTGQKIDNKILNWEMIRRLRQLFGPNGSIIYHCTNRGTPVATVPNIETYCTATYVGEIDYWAPPGSSYVQYQVKKYGISNTVAFWLPYHAPASFTYFDQIDAILAMNGRLLDVGGVDVLTPPKTASGKYEWCTLTNSGYQTYLKRLADMKTAHLKNNTQQK